MSRFTENNICVLNTNLITSIVGMYARKVEATLDQYNMLEVKIDFEIQRQNRGVRKVTIKLRGDEIAQVKRGVTGKQQETTLIRGLRMSGADLRYFFILNFSLAEEVPFQESYYLVNTMARALVNAGQREFTITKDKVVIGEDRGKYNLVMRYQAETETTCSFKIGKGATYIQKHRHVPNSQLLEGLKYLASPGGILPRLSRR